MSGDAFEQALDAAQVGGSASRLFAHLLRPCTLW